MKTASPPAHRAGAGATPAAGSPTGGRLDSPSGRIASGITNAAHNWKRLPGKAAKAVGVLLSLYAAFSFLAAYLLTHPPNKRVGPLPSNFPCPLEAVQFETGDGLLLKGWYGRAHSGAPAVVLLHGYRGNRHQTLTRARFLNGLGYTVMLYDARGCGESDGSETTIGFREREDLKAAIAYVRMRGAESVACLGISQGAATILLAAEELGDVSAVICESPYSTLSTALENRFRHYLGIPPISGSLTIASAEWLLDLSVNEVSPLLYIGKLRPPLLMMSGDEDRRSRPADIRALLDAAPREPELWMVPGAGHGDLYDADPQEYERRLQSFLKTHLPVAQPQRGTLPNE